MLLHFLCKVYCLSHGSRGAISGPTIRPHPLGVGSLYSQFLLSFVCKSE